jgi:hypothetical protein
MTPEYKKYPKSANGRTIYPNHVRVWEASNDLQGERVRYIADAMKPNNNDGFGSKPAVKDKTIPIAKSRIGRNTKVRPFNNRRESDGRKGLVRIFSKEFRARVSNLNTELSSRNRERHDAMYDSYGKLKKKFYSYEKRN